MNDQDDSHLQYERYEPRWMPLLLILIPWAYYWQVTLLGLSPGQGDVPLQFLPWKLFWRESILSGRIPLWNPHTACGAPFLANFQSGVFSPVDWLLLPLSPERTFGVSLVLHTILALLFTYGLGRSLGLSRTAGTLAALAFGLCGFHHIHLFAGNFLTFSATVWFPLLCWMTWGLVQSIRRRGSCSMLLRWGWGLCIALILQLLSAHPQMIFYALVFTSLWAVGLILPNKEERWLRLGKLVLVFLTAGVLALLVCSIQLLPTLEYIRWSSRGEGLTWDEATQFSFSFSRLLTLPLADFFGSFATQDYWGYWKDWSSAYPGLWVSLFAVCAAVVGIKNRKRDSFPIGASLLLAAVAVFLALGRHNPLYRLVLMLPGFEYFRAPSKFLPYFILPLALLGGRGWDLWLLRENSKPERPKEFFLRKEFWLPAFVIIAALMAVALEWTRFSSSAQPAVFRSVVWAGGIYVTGILIFLLAKKNVSIRKITGLLFIALLLVDLYAYGHRYFQFHSSQPRWEVLRRVVAPALRDPQGGRVLAYRIFEPNEAIPLGVETPGWYDPLSIRHYSEWLRYYGGDDRKGFVDGFTPPIQLAPLAALLLNIRYHLVQEGEWLRLHPVENPGRRVIFYPLSAARFEAYPWHFNPAEELYLSRGNDRQPPEERKTLSAETSGMEYTLPPQPVIQIRNISPEHWAIDYQSDEAGYFFISDTYYPGWKCFLNDSQELEILRANHAFRAVEIPAGRHSILMKYEPDTFRAGLYLSLIGVAILLCSGGVIWSRKKAVA